jgi:ATP adenylyltransferase
VNYFKVSFAIFDKYPVNPGHALVIPQRYCSSYFELTADEQSACWQLLNDVAAIIRERFNPNGFNIGINIGRAAGQPLITCTCA